MASTWVPPLPPGYEARWDPNQKAYFFINHQTKTTTWQDPRWPAAPKAPQQPAVYHAAAARNLNKGFATSGQGQHVPMTTMYKQFGGTTTRSDGSDDEDWENDWDSETELPFKDSTGDHERKVDIAKLHQLKQLFPSAPEDVIRRALINNNNVMGMTTGQLSAAGYKKEEATSHPPPRAVDMLERLRAMYPTANPGLVSDILHQANYDEKDARAQLEAIGYRAQYAPTHKTHDPSPKRSVSPARETSPKRASPAKPSMSDAQKAKVLAKLKSQYKDTDESVITMALQVCDYDESRVKSLLDRMQDEEETPRPSSSRPGTSKSSHSARSPSPTPVVSSTSLEPVAIDIDLSSIVKTGRVSRPGTSTSSSRTTPDKKTPSKTSRTPTPKTSSSSQKQQRSKYVTQLSEDVLSSTIDVLNHLTANVSCCSETDDHSANQGEELALTANQNEADDSHRRQEVVSRQPHTVGVSEYRTTAKGPDFSLRTGPNKDLLIKEYILAKGPNPEFRQGPDPSRVMGSQGAVGPDRSLCCGPQFGLSKGTSSENLIVTAV